MEPDSENFSLAVAEAILVQATIATQSQAACHLADLLVDPALTTGFRRGSCYAWTARSACGNLSDPNPFTGCSRIQVQQRVAHVDMLTMPGCFR
jgi:hypothetical protein